MPPPELVVTIDTGTTNTRVSLWRDRRVVGRAAADVGVRDTSMTGSTERLRNGVHGAIAAVLAETGAAAAEVRLFLATGMITSNVGLMELPHVAAPAGIAELAAAMADATIPTIAPAPIWFVPGVRNAAATVDLDTWEAMDIMRGEEVETFGVLRHLGLGGPALLILPGSHSKFISVDANARIAGCVTTLAGELLSVVTRETILAGALERSFATTLDEAMVVKGADAARRVGLNRACFGVRILDQFTKTSRDALANFLAGAVVATDLMALKSSRAIHRRPGVPIVIGGTNLLARVFATLVAGDPELHQDPVLVDEATMRDASGMGAMAVARARGLLEDTGSP